MSDYCTYFDAGFLPQGLALWHSLRRHEPEAVLWVLALDEAAAVVLLARGESDLRVVRLSQLESGDGQLAEAKNNRSRVEYYFTLSPCWPLWLLTGNPAMASVTYLDADLFFFASPRSIADEVVAAGASVGIAAHGYPPALSSLEKWGRFNVGVQHFRNDERGRCVLADWRQRCLEWCHDRVEGERFADQKYLDVWPIRFGAAVHIYRNPGINAAPWNWSSHGWTRTVGPPEVAGSALVVFHFAKFRSLCNGLWDSGQLEFAVMPRWLREQIYEPYWQALALHSEGVGGGHSLRRRRAGLKAWVLGLFFGALWLRVGGHWLALGALPFGRYSGEWLQRWRRRKACA
jgi:hypothetical protein